MTKQLIGMDESDKAPGCPVHQEDLVDLLEFLMPSIRHHPWGETREKPGTGQRRAGRESAGSVGSTRAFGRSPVLCRRIVGPIPPRAPLRGRAR